MSQQITQTGDRELFGSEIQNDQAQEMRAACRVGLLLWNDDLEASHAIAQSLDTPTGSYWHALIHRREGDFPNANYWWRRTGAHPAFEEVRAAAESTLRNESNDQAQEFLSEINRLQRWNPETFVKLCEQAQPSGRSSEWLQRVQVAEIETLLGWCLRQA